MVAGIPLRGDSKHLVLVWLPPQGQGILLSGVGLQGPLQDPSAYCCNKIELQGIFTEQGHPKFSIAFKLSF